MKRYFTFETPPDPMQYSPRGMYHYMSLPGSGYICVLEEESAEVPADWIELPHLLEQAPAYFDGIQHVCGTASGSSSSAASASTQTVTTPAVSAQVTAATPQTSATGVTNSSGLTPLAGISVSDTTFQLAKKLASINRNFHP